MGDVLMTVVVIVLAIAALLGLLGGLYWLMKLLPPRMAERGRVGVFLLPAMFVMLIGLVVPALKTIWASLYDDYGKQFIGLDNYKEIFKTNDARLTVLNSLTWVVVGTVVTVLVGLAIARFTDGMRGEKSAKSLIFIPGAISLVGAGIIWRFVYAGPPFKVGLLNAITKAVPGLPTSVGGDGARLWLVERGVAGLEPPKALPGFNTLLLICFRGSPTL